MLKKFLGLSDDGFRLYECFTPGERGDVGIKMIIGYKDEAFKVFSSEVWDDPAEEALERQAQSAADGTRSLHKQLSQLQMRVGAVKSNMFGKPYLGAIAGSFADLEAKAVYMQLRDIKPRSKAGMSYLLGDYVHLKKPKLNPEQQGQPDRKPQPNRGPRGRKDWK